MNQRSIQSYNQNGQTLIETMVAIFILIMGITAALGLANYSLSSSTSVTKQIIGTGLSREGAEAVKNMRDTNWLRDTFDGTCNCYSSWENSLYNIKSNTSGKTYSLTNNPGQDAYWVLNVENSNFALNFDAAATNGSFYYPANSNQTGTSDYYRRITLTEVQTAPYDSTSPRIRVDSDVWWKDKKCPAAATYEAATPSCRIRLTTYLTNWKNY
jgi:Tfp pilus assembly protein PilV